MQNSLLFFPPPPPPFPSLLSSFPPPPPPSADNRRTRSRALKARRGNKPRPQKVRRNVRSQRTSVYRGVTKHKYTGKYEARLWDKDGFTANKKGRQYHLGGYDDEELAAQAYDLAAIKCWGNEAVLNFPANIYEREAILMEHFPKVDYLVSLRRRSTGFARGMSNYRGVSKHHHEGRWEARLGMVRGKKYIYLGSFDTPEKAAEAYDRAAVFHRGPSAITNFDISNYITTEPPQQQQQEQQLPQYIPQPQPQPQPQPRRLPLLLPRPFPLRPFPQLQYITMPQPPQPMPMPPPQPLPEPPTVDLPPPLAPPEDLPNQEMDTLPEISWDLSSIDLNFEDFDIPDISTSQPDGLSDDSGNASLDFDFDFDLDGIWPDQYVEESEKEVQLNRMDYVSVTETTTTAAAVATTTAAVDGVAQEEAMDSGAFTTNTVTAAVDGLAQEEAMDSGASTSERPEPFGFPFDEEYYSVCFSPLIGIF